MVAGTAAAVEIPTVDCYLIRNMGAALCAHYLVLTRARVRQNAHTELPRNTFTTGAMPDFARMDRLLAGVSVDDMPHFSKTLLTSSPVLLVLHLESGNAVPLPHVEVGMSDASVPPPTSMVRTTSKSDVDIAIELPESLQELMREHKRAAHSLFLRWEQSGQREIPLRAFAEGVHQITRAQLSDEDLVIVLQCAEPVLGNDIAGDDQWRSRMLDANRLWRCLQNSAARLASQYIKHAQGQGKSKASPCKVSPGKVSPLKSSITKAASFTKMLEDHEARRGGEQQNPKARAASGVPSEAAQIQLRDALGRRLTEVSDLFVQWDYDGNGLVDRAEFREAVSTMGLHFDEAVVDGVFDIYDLDGSGEIAYSEYVRHTLRDALARSMGRVVDIFRKWDDDSSGTVDKKEFRRAIREIGFEAPRGALDELFDDLDADRGGTIEYKELHSALRQGAAMKLKPVLKPGGAGAIETKASNRLRVADCGRSAVKRM